MSYLGVKMNLNVSEIINEYKEEAIKLACDLIKIPSENVAPDGHEKEAQLYLMDWFLKNGISVDKFELLSVEGLESHEAYWPGRNYKDRPNVVAFIKGSWSGKSIIFSSHIDTVTRDPIPWVVSGPFSGEVIGDRLYGRGSYDMKAGLAASAIILKIIKDLNIKLSGDIFVESVVDEENAGSNGTLASKLKGYNPDVVIIPEPTNLTICPHPKGGQLFEILFKGRAGVSYGGEDVINPLYNMAKIINKIEEYERKINKIENPPKFYENDKKPRYVVLAKAKSGDLKLGGNVGIPEEAWLEMFDFLNQVIESDPSLKKNPPVIKPSSRFLYPAMTDSSHPIFELISKKFIDITGKEPVITGASFACDSFIFNKYFNVPTVNFGLVGGNAHGKDEWFSINSFFDYIKINLAVILEWCKKEYHLFLLFFRIFQDKKAYESNPIFFKGY
jgi:acetylornithine deacetylase